MCKYLCVLILERPLPNLNERMNCRCSLGWQQDDTLERENVDVAVVCDSTCQDYGKRDLPLTFSSVKAERRKKRVSAYF